MKLNKILLTASILFGGLCASAQEEVTEYVFQPHWFGQAQFGVQETLGEGGFDILAGPNAQLAGGYQFSPIFGLRLSVNSWRSRATSEITRGAYLKDPAKLTTERYKWHWTYIAPSLEGQVSLTNLIGGYNPTRLVDVNVFAGIGLNIAWKNNEANAINDSFRSELMAAAGNIANAPADINGAQPDFKNYNMLGYIWEGTHTRLTGRMGFDVNFRVSDRVQLGIEANANVLNDHYNSKKAGNADWYFNILGGVKYAFGPTYKKVTRVIEPVVPCEPQIIEKIVEKIVEVPVQVQEVKKEATSIRRDIFFKINKTVVTPDEMTKVAAIADYLNQHPDAKVVITGYADKGTGSKAINLRLAAKRAEVVAQCLRTQFGIPASRMTVKSMGDLEDQPYPDPVQNRVAICIAN